MKFKKNYYYIFLFLVEVAVFLSIFVIFAIYHMEVGGYLICSGGILSFLLMFEIICKFGMFYDTVYCDEEAIKIVRRRKILEYPWSKIKYLRMIVARGGITGWQIVTYSGEKNELFPPNQKIFIDYVKSIRPDIERRTW